MKAASGDPRAVMGCYASRPRRLRAGMPDQANRNRSAIDCFARHLGKRDHSVSAVAADRRAVHRRQPFLSSHRANDTRRWIAERRAIHVRRTASTEAGELRNRGARPRKPPRGAPPAPRWRARATRVGSRASLPMRAPDGDALHWDLTDLAATRASTACIARRGAARRLERMSRIVRRRGPCRGGEEGDG